MSTFSEDNSHYVQPASSSYKLLNCHKNLYYFWHLLMFRKKDICALFIRFAKYLHQNKIHAYVPAEDEVSDPKDLSINEDDNMGLNMINDGLDLIPFFIHLTQTKL